MKSYTTIEPRFVETDQMGIIHHSVYPTWYEVGRVKFCEDIGMPFHDIVAHHVHMALTHVEVDYHKPARFGEILKVQTTLKSMTKVRMIFTYEITNEHGEIINTGSTTLVWLDESLRPINIYKVHPHMYDLFQKAVSSSL
jgi:acyl-CoA thioester hydrolase